MIVCSSSSSILKHNSDFGNSVDDPCKLDIVVAYAIDVVCDKVDPNAVVNVKPFRMVVHLFCIHCNFCHKSKCLHKVVKLKCIVYLAVDNVPVVKLAYLMLYFSLRQFTLLVILLIIICIGV